MKKLLDISLDSLPDGLYAKAVLENLDEKSKKSLIKNVKSCMTQKELIKLNEIKSKKANYKVKEYIV
ncbi:MAG: hypothetical protein OEV44_06830 [Spirochaetota bacterium]|nr:hypothetical protein [Spirochaetota bacterium]